MSSGTQESEVCSPVQLPQKAEKYNRYFPKLAGQKKFGIRVESEARDPVSARFWPCKLKGKLVFTAQFDIRDNNLANSVFEETIFVHK